MRRNTKRVKLPTKGRFTIAVEPGSIYSLECVHCGKRMALAYRVGNPPLQGSGFVVVDKNSSLNVFFTLKKAEKYAERSHHC